MMLTAGVIAATVVGVVCLILIFHHDYEDGLIGRFGLFLISVAAFFRVVEGVESIVIGTYDGMTKIGICLWTGVAIFMSRHLYRFLRTRKHPDWRPIRK